MKPFTDYLLGYIRLLDLTRDDDALDSDEANALRDSLDAPWRKVSRRGQVSMLDAALDIIVKEHDAQTIPDTEKTK